MQADVKIIDRSGVYSAAAVLAFPTNLEIIEKRILRLLLGGMWGERTFSTNSWQPMWALRTKCGGAIERAYGVKVE
jgi:hypothetical protein